jgi:sulfate-transporting ATPase
VKIAHVDQSRESLQGDKTVFEDVCGGQDNITVGKFQMPSRVVPGALQLSAAPTSRRSVGQLSGGERGRLQLAKQLVSGANVLLLDEPRTTSTWKRCARWRRRCWSSPAACW